MVRTVIKLLQVVNADCVVAERSSALDYNFGVLIARVRVRVPVLTLVSLSKTLIIAFPFGWDYRAIEVLAR